MPNLYSTLMIAFVFIVLTIAGLAIGWLVAGKTKVVQPNDLLNKGSAPEKENLNLQNTSSNIDSDSKQTISDKHS